MGNVIKLIPKIYLEEGTFTGYFYSEILEMPEWKKRRLEIIDSRGGKCERCASTDFLQVHHKSYRKIGKRRVLPWLYRDDEMELLCGRCHRLHHKEEKEQEEIKKFLSMSFSGSISKAESLIKCLSFLLKCTSDESIVGLCLKSKNSFDDGTGYVFYEIDASFDAVSYAVKNCQSPLISHNGRSIIVRHRSTKSFRKSNPGIEIPSKVNQYLT